MSFELSQQEGEFLINLVETQLRLILKKAKESNRPKIRQRKCLSTVEFS